VAFELEEETISSLREKLSSGKYTSEQLVQLYLDRIETIDKNGLELHSIIEVNSEAIAIAKTMDAEMKAGKSRGPLHGIPVVIKIISTQLTKCKLLQVRWPWKEILLPKMLCSRDLGMRVPSLLVKQT
jgi:hypothetical protein